MLCVPWSQSSNSFFEAVVNGAKDAAAQQGVNLDIKFGEEDKKNQLGILETGIANGVSAIAVNVADDDVYVRDLKKEGVSSVLVTHNLCHAFMVGDRFVVMSHGSKVFEADKKDTTIEELTDHVIRT
jgi:DNA-binding LacI/PurR family transcriptional regulator